MSTPTTKEELESYVAQQAHKVREMKAAKASTEEIKAAVEELKLRKKLLAEHMPKESDGPKFNRKQFDELMKRRFFFAPSFEIYGGVAGLYDYGPSGCAIMSNLLAAWRNHFVLEEGMLEVSCTAMTPHHVLEASGHVARFADIMVRDAKTGDCYRADHLLEDIMDAKIKASTNEDEKKEFAQIAAQADAFTKEELKGLFERFEIKAPATGNDLTEPIDFNMMFGTSIGPTGDLKGFLRPETAQGMFLCFKRLYEFNNNRLPFASAQVGPAFRNEISPRAGLLRVREFTMAEIEHFVDPEDKSHPKFQSVAHLELPLFSACNQMDGKPLQTMALGDAVKQGIIANETLGYFVGRIFTFMCDIGVDQNRIRFRQHLSNEMAHYAQDCWDCELETSYGWVECVGCADRSCYDLEQHAKASGKELLASAQLKEPIISDLVLVEPVKSVIGKKFKRDGKLIMAHFANMSNDDAVQFEQNLQDGPVTLNLDGRDFEISSDMIKIVRKQEKSYERKFVPSVIEPSFGVGRIIYALLEHSFKGREGDEQRCWLDLAPILAPVKCSLLPLSSNDDFKSHLNQLASELPKAGISFRLDDSSASIGRRYARTDEIGIPFGITVDFDSLKDNTVTLRQAKSMSQVRIPMDEVVQVVSELAQGSKLWDEVSSKYPAQEAAE